MRVISGTAKGRRLKAPPGLNTRPVTDMIKEALFNVWGSRVLDACVLDLFAGSGSVGIEALSRGARKVIFVDNSNAAVRVIRENLDHCRFQSGFDILRGDVFQALKRLVSQGLQFDLVYIDPPFTREDIFEPLMEAVSRADILSADGIAVIRSPRKKAMPSFPLLVKYRQGDYGESSLHYYCRCEEEPNDDGDISHS
ncbi:MAG: 16S rRNA (guanine(966)-N(2))-methyltransferase RsmD [Syntrophomonadaceae bacterium]